MRRIHVAALLGALLLAVPLHALPQSAPAASPPLPATVSKIRPGEVNISLALATASLSQHGVRRPTSEQLKAALEGGTVISDSGTRVTLPGVLRLRASGMRWDEIAHRQRVQLETVARPQKFAQPQRPEIFERPQRLERFERPQRPERPERPHRPERPERHGRR